MTEEFRKQLDGSYDIPVGEGHVGAELFEILSRALYPTALDVLREYTQNSVDALATSVSFVISSDSIEITDNGRGMSLRELDGARKVAVSTKQRQVDAGFRGIGIYSSFAACRTLTIETRATGHDAYRLTIEFDTIRKSLEEAKGRNRSLSVVRALKLHSRIQDAQPISDKPYTKIILGNPEPSFVHRVSDYEALARYLSAAVPLDFNNAFEHRDSIRDAIQKNVPDIRLITMSISLGLGDARILTQPGGTDLLPPTFEVLQDDAGKPLAFLWACLNRERRAIQPQDLQGFLLRLKGFGIGGRQFPRGLWGRRGYGVLYPWYTGEIYVLDQDIVPNAGRDDLEEALARDRLFAKLGKAFERLERSADKRRSLLLAVDKGTKNPAAAPLVENVMQGLADIRQELGLPATLEARKLLDAKAQAVIGTADAILDKGASKRPSDSPPITSHVSPTGTEGFNHGNGQVALPAPSADSSITEMLLQYLDWREDEKEALGIVDAVLTDNLDPMDYTRCARDVERRLKEWAEGNDKG